MGARTERDPHRPPPSAPEGLLERHLKISRWSYPVPAHGNTLPYTLGGITLIGFALLFMTGMLLEQFVDPSPDRAYASVKALVEEVPGGAWIRAMHYWTAQAIVITLGLHVLRVFVTGSYKTPRVLTWYLGLGLLGAGVFGSYFTGTVLKGDQEAFDALVHYREGVQWLGGVGAWLASTEWISLHVKLFASHVSILPLLLVVLLAGHLYLVSVHNLSPLPVGEDARRTTVPAEEMTGRFPDHVRSLLIYSAIAFASVAVVAWVVPAPLGEPASDIEMSIKPPWPFLWLYGLENMTGRMDTMMHGILVLFVLLALVPVLDRGVDRHPRRRKVTLGLGGLVLLSLLGLSVYAGVTPPQLHEHDHQAPPAGVESGDAPPEHPHDPSAAPHTDRH